MDLVHQLEPRMRGPASGCPVVVVVQLTHDWKSDHLLPCILSARNRSLLLRDLLRNPLMGPCLVEAPHILIQNAARAAFPEELTDGRDTLVAHFLNVWCEIERS
jgi:hypothetical protein